MTQKTYKVEDDGCNVLAVGTRDQCDAAATEIERDHDRAVYVRPVEDDGELATLRDRVPEVFCRP